MVATRSSLSRLAALTVLLTLAGCFPSYKVIVAQKADWRTGGAVLHGWIVCKSAEDEMLGCTKSQAVGWPALDEKNRQEVRRIQAEVRKELDEVLSRLCPQGHEIVETSVPGWSRTVPTPPVTLHDGTVSFYECKP